jgi:hypothetical protein
MQLHAIDKKEPTKEFVGGKRKPVIDQGEKHYPKASFRA